MGNRRLSPDEAESVANAIQLVREAGFDEKANLLDDMLEDGDIQINPDLPPTQEGRRVDWLWPFSDVIELNPQLFGDQAPFDRCHPRIVSLAGVLMHEANHAMGHGEIEAWGNTVLFYERLNAGFDGFFRDCSPRLKEEIKKFKEQRLASARERRKAYARDAGRLVNPAPGARSLRAAGKPMLHPPYVGEPFVGGLQPRSGAPRSPYPPPPQTPIQERLSRLACALLRYRHLTGALPEGDNAAEMAALRAAHLLDLPASAFNAKGEALDLGGCPLMYQCPGRLYQDAFDLYSVDPTVPREKAAKPAPGALPARPRRAAEIAFLDDA